MPSFPSRLVRPEVPSLSAAARSRCSARAEAQEPVEGAPFCGWFDSSHDLQQGLAISEHGELDGATLELAVRLWVQ